MSESVEVERSSGNVFADIGLPDPEERLAKATLAARIYQIITERKLTRRKAAKLLGIDQAELSALTKGLLDDFSLERLCRFLNALDQDVEIVITAKRGDTVRFDVRVEPA